MTFAFPRPSRFVFGDPEDIPIVDWKLNRFQREFVFSQHPWAAMVGGRGSGKTYAGSRLVYRLAQENPGVPGLITANTAEQLARSTIRPLLEFLDSAGIAYVFGSRPKWYTSPLPDHRGVLSLRNGTQIYTRGLDNHDPIRGLNVGWVWADEVRDTSKEAWDTMLACVRGYGVRYVRVTTTPNGYDHVYESFVDKPSRDPELASKRLLVRCSTHANVENLGEDFIEDLLSSYDEEWARQEVFGEFINVGSGLVYTSFARDTHVRSTPYQEGLPLILSCDFNVHNMCWVVGQYDGRMLRVIDEVVVRRPLHGLTITETAAHAFAERYGRHVGDVLIYGDYYGDRQSSTTTRTDYDLLHSVLVSRLHRRDRNPALWNPIRRCVSTDKGGNPPVVDRVSAVNAMLRNALGDVRIAIDPRCAVLIRDLERVRYVPGTTRREIDKRSDPSLTHASDALGYLVFALMRSGRSGNVAVGSRSEGLYS